MTPGGKYCFSKTLNFGERDVVTIYQSNKEIYNTANYVDLMSSTLATLSTFKVGSNLYALTMATGAFSVASSAFWGGLLFFQIRYLKFAYLQQVYLIEKMQLHKDLDKVRVHTMFHNYNYNIFANIRTRFRSNTPSTVYEFPISECRFAENNSAQSQVLRLQLGEMKYFCHKSRAEF